MTTGPSEAVREPELPAPGIPPQIPRPRDAPPTDPPEPAQPAEPSAAASRRWGFGAYLFVEAVFLLSSLLLVLPYAGELDQGPPPAPVLLLSLTVPTILSAVTAILITWRRGNGPRVDLGLHFSRSDLTRGLAFGSAGLLLTIPAAALWSHVAGPEASSAVAELFKGLRFSLPVAFAVFLMVWLVAPICEEIVYRGLLWGAMERHGLSRWWAFSLTTLLFALAHFEFTRTPLLLVIAVPIGLARLYSNGLGASIVAHQVNNALPAVGLFMLLIGVHPPAA